MTDVSGGGWCTCKYFNVEVNGRISWSRKI